MILLDTCTLLWLVSAQNNLSKHACQVLTDNANALFISVISAFEIGTKLNKKLLQLPLPAEEWWSKSLYLHGLTELPIHGEIALYATQLPPIHKDPADRFIVATAYKHQLSILTPDSHISAYKEIKTIW